MLIMLFICEVSRFRLKRGYQGVIFQCEAATAHYNKATVTKLVQDLSANECQGSAKKQQHSFEPKKLCLECNFIRTSIDDCYNIFNINMKPGLFIEQNNKDTSEELLKQILDENAALNSVGFAMLGQFFAAFKIADTGMMDLAERLKKIKQKLLDIIIDEKEECANYLTLPKFKNMSEGAKATLKEVMVQAWSTYQQRAVQEEKNRKYSRYFCRFDNLKQTEEFHLNLFQSIKSFYFYQGSHHFYRNFPPMMAPPPSAEHYPGYSSMPMQAMTDPYYGMQMGSHPAQPSSAPPPNSSHALATNNSIKIQQKEAGGFNNPYSYQNEFPINPKPKKYTMSEEPSSRFNKYQRDSTQTAYAKSFSNCVCRGKRSEQERYFECGECKRRYHLTCLNIPNYAVEKVGVQKQCPQCTFKNNNAFYSVIGEPLETFWSDDKELHKQKITIKSKKCKEITDKKHIIQLRFIKIEGRCMFDWEPSGSVKEEHNAIVRQKKSKLNEVLIKDQVLSKGGGEDVKISLDCMKNQDDRGEDRKPILLFVALNTVKEKNLQQILETEYEYFEEDYLDRFLKDKHEIKIEIFDPNFKIFTTPIRGDECEHADLYDLAQFVNHCLELHTDQCFCCSKRCRTFKIDRKVEAEVKRIKQQIPDESRYPSAIYYQRDGTFRWADVSPADPVPHSNMEAEARNDDGENNFPDLDIEISQESSEEAGEQSQNGTR